MGLFEKAYKYGHFLKRHTHIAISRRDAEKISQFIVNDKNERKKRQKSNPDMIFFKSRGELFSWYLKKYGEPYKNKKKRETSKII
jgi:hypothetical protein